jgi:site-specific DNA recombinase
MEVLNSAGGYEVSETDGRPGLRAAIYARVSDPKQVNGASLDTQMAACRRHATERGWWVDERHVHREIYTAKELHERPRLTALREAIRDGALDVVVCYAVDRLTRNQAHMYILVDEFERRGVRLEFVTEQFEDTAVGKFILSAKTFAAELEREKIIERTYRGTIARARAGKPLAGPHPPYGYRWNGDKSAYEVDPIAAPVVRRIFREATAGRSLRQIAIGLGADGIASPGGKPYWHFTTVRLILRSRIYIGEAAALRTRTVRLAGGGYRMTRRPEHEHIPLPEGVAPPLVDRATFEAVQERLRANQERAARNNRTPEGALLRAGFIRCGHCNNRMYVYTHSRRDTWSYRCGAKLHVGGCRGNAVRVAEVDAFVWDRVREVLLDPDIVARELARLRADDPTERDLADIDRALAEIAKLQERATRAILLLEDDAAAPLVAQLKALSERRRELATEREAVLARRAGWDAARSRLVHIDAVRAGIAAELDTLAYQERRLALDALGVRVKAYRPEHGSRLVVELDLAVADDIAFNSASA